MNARALSGQERKMARHLPRKDLPSRRAKKRFGLLLLFLLLPLTAEAQGFASLGTAQSGFAPVTAPAHLEFPRDHGPHDGYRIEWWYLTANLRAEDGAEYGVQWTLFRAAQAPGPEGKGWESSVIWMGHAALTTASRHLSAETFARGGVGQAGVALDPFRAWIDDWSLSGASGPGDALGDLAVTAGGKDFSYRLRAVTDRAPVPQGENGYSVKSTEGQASYYYSQPFYAVSGTLSIDGRDIAVSGRGWLDREWSSQPLAPDQLGWDWFSLHLDDGAKVMLYRMRNRTAPPFVTGTWITADGTATPLRSGQITLSPRDWTDVAGHRLPTGWSLDIPDHGLKVDTAPLNGQSWMGTLFPYWEGPIRIEGSHSGRGYLEMTGYP